ncbi:hypothetical protein AB4Z00_26360 [Novosphingobium sp. YAF33]
MYMTKTWGVSVPSGPLQFSTNGWRINARSTLEPSDLVGIVGTEGTVTDENEQGRILGLMEPTRHVVSSLVEQRYFPGPTVSELSWDKDPARSRAIQHFQDSRLFDLPKLLDAMPYLFEKDVDSIHDAVARLQEDGTGKLAA